MRNHLNENDFDLRENEREWFCTYTRFETEAKGNSEIAYCPYECFRFSLTLIQSRDISLLAIIPIQIHWEVESILRQLRIGTHFLPFLPATIKDSL